MVLGSLPGDFGWPHLSQSNPEQLGRFLPHGVVPLQQLQAWGRPPELSALGTDGAKEANPVCRERHSPGSPCPRLQGTSVPVNPEQQQRPSAPRGAPGRTVGRDKPFPSPWDVTGTVAAPGAHGTVGSH